jgi:hypothetical protein
MHRLAIVLCGVVLLGSTVVALAAYGKTNADSSLLAKRGLTQFDLDGNGKLDASERAAALAARRTGRKAPSDSMSAGSLTDNPYSNPAAYPYPQFSPSGGYPYFPPRGIRSNLPGGYVISPTQSPQTVDVGLCRYTGQDVYVTVSQGPAASMGPGAGSHVRSR